MTENYWKFLLGLQHNAQLFFDDKISYYHIPHPWSIHTHEVFMVRDIDTQALIYDSIDALVVDMFHQGMKHCACYPFTLLFPDVTRLDHTLALKLENYPVLVFNSGLRSLALVKLEKEPTKNIEPIGDPREFWGVSSSQDSQNYLLFSLLELNITQHKKMRQFDDYLNWESYYLETQNLILTAPYQLHPHSPLNFLNNLFFNSCNEQSTPLLENPNPQANLAFTLIDQIQYLQINLKEFKQSRNEMSAYQNLDIEARNQFAEYESTIQNKYIDLICHTANKPFDAYISTKTRKALLTQIQMPPETERLVSAIEDTPQDCEQQISGLRAAITLIIVLGIVFLILYGGVLLVEKYSFVKFILMITTAIAVLAIITRK
ncbi:MAG: hypothetical protein E6Q26_00790 [Acinetobacter sp.]|nr:MAG: hypothetical protein E6Q26_00790 [Acinetobacter sp.]